MDCTAYEGQQQTTVLGCDAAFCRPLPEVLHIFPDILPHHAGYQKVTIPILDAFEMVRYEIIDDADPRLVYTGNWNLLTTPVNAKNPEYNGTVHATNDPSATVSFNFTGEASFCLSSTLG